MITAARTSQVLYQQAAKKFHEQVKSGIEYSIVN